MADFHLGSPHTDYQAFLDTTDLLLGHDIHFIVVGPDLETAFTWFRSAEAVLNQVIPPWMQIEMYRQWLDEMLPKCVATCGDNHTDQRLERHLGDIGLVWRTDLPYFRTFGRLEVEVGPENGPTEMYDIILSHKYKGSSIYHNLQPVLRLMRDIYPIADVYMTAHTHKPAYMSGIFYEEARPILPDQHFIVCGGFKNNGDLFSLRNFGGGGVLGLPTLALWPDRHEIAYFRSPQLALEVMNSEGRYGPGSVHASVPEMAAEPDPDQDSSGEAGDADPERQEHDAAG
jgi:hypothetical protein